MTRLFIDDNRECPQSFDSLARCYTTATAKLALGGPWEVVSFDHDMEFEHYGCDYSDGRTGYDVLIWLIQEVQEGRIKKPERIILHTGNPQGRARMIGALKVSGWDYEIG